MSEDPEQPIVLTTVASEAEGAMIVAALDDHGFKAQMSGQLTSGFRAEAPGKVSILVRRADAERAKATLREIREGSE